MGLASRVVSRGGAVAVAWNSRAAPDMPPWQPEGRARLKPCRDRVASAWTGLGGADRGLDAQGLCQAIGALGWHPLLRLNQPGQCRPPGGSHWVPVPTRVPAVGRRWQGPGTAFPGPAAQVDCTRVGWGAAGHQAAWLVLTDRPPHPAQVCWEGRRA